MLIPLLAGLFLSLSSADGRLALDGLDPVALCQGGERAGLVGLTETYGPFEYRFASEANRQSFLAEPNRWSIQWNGGCGRMGPLSGRGSPERWLLHQERIYIFASDACRNTFEASPEQFVVPRVPRPEPTANALARGEAWLERVIEAHGGVALEGAGFLHASRQARHDDWLHEEDLWIAATGELRRRSRWTQGEGDAGEAFSTDWFLGERSFEKSESGLVPLVGPDIRADLVRYTHRALLPLLWARESPSFSVVEASAEGAASPAVVRLSIFYRGLETHLDVDTETARVKALSWRGRLGDGRTRDIVERFTAWHEVAGVWVPTGREVSIDGEPNETHSTTSESWELTVQAPVGLFDPTD